jgi:hypothetical protein
MITFETVTKIIEQIALDGEKTLNDQRQKASVLNIKMAKDI